MFQPNVLAFYLLKRGRLEDTRRESSTPQETSFPDYEVGSTTRECHAPGYLRTENPSDLGASADLKSPEPAVAHYRLEAVRNRSTRCNIAKERINA